MVPVGPDCVGTGQCSPLRDPVEGWPGREGEVPQVDPALNAGANLAIPVDVSGVATATATGACSSCTSVLVHPEEPEPPTSAMEGSFPACSRRSDGRLTGRGTITRPPFGTEVATPERESSNIPPCDEVRPARPAPPRAPVPDPEPLPLPPAPAVGLP